MARYRDFWLVTLPLFLSAPGGEGGGDSGLAGRRGHSSADVGLVPDGIPDRAVVLRVRGPEGEARAACEALYLEHAGHLIPFAYGYVRSDALAEEIVHDVFLAIWMRRHEWLPRGGVAAYLYAAVRNRALKVVRHTAIVERHAPDIVQSQTSVVQPLDGSDVGALAAALKRAVAELPERSREALTLRRNHKLSFREIGQLLGVSEDAARVRVARAEQTLRAALASLLE